MIKDEYCDGVKQYFNRIKDYKTLDLEQQRKLFNQYRKGDLKSRDSLINSHLKFVVHIAKGYRNRGVPMDSLISEGNFGLIKAIDKFDNNKNNLLTTYSVSWIRAFIENRIKRDRLIADHTISNESITLNQHNKGLDSPNVSSSQIIDVVFENDKEDYYKLTLDNIMKSTLDERECEIIKYSFGLDNSKILSLKDIGKKLNISTERVRQIKQKSLMKLRSKCLELDVDLYL